MADSVASVLSHRRFEGMPVVVTGVGGAGQAGEAVAAAFGRSGAIVHCVNRGIDVRDRVAELVAKSINAVAHSVDLTDFAGTQTLASDIASKHGGRIVAVAHLAGGFALSGPIAASDESTFAKQMAINLSTAYSVARAFAPPVRAARGAFVFVTSAAVLDGGKVAGLSAYAAAKGGVIQVMRAVAQEERQFGVRANAIAPTAIRTAANLHAMGDGVRYVEREEISSVILALCDSELGRVTGQVIEIA